MGMAARCNFSRHGRQRTDQRGMSEYDIEVILRFGSAVDSNAVLLSEQDVVHAIEILSRLKNCKVVIGGEAPTVVTAYRTTRKHRKKVLQRARDEGWIRK